ncbi:MAG TPA: phosphate ABC transporter substrate-binding protein [Anaerolineae bacterium]|nr:phosphate ABC transporter substrate-binding protein [Anaerolineae bacterium]
MKFSFLHLSSFILLLLLTACGATVTPPPPVVITAAGSTSMAPLLADLTSAYSAQHPHITFDIQGGGSQLGQTLVEAGQIDLGLVSWPPQNLPNKLRSMPVARDAIAVVTHPQNKIEGLSLIDLRDIFRGRLLNWQEVGGSATPIQVVSREDGSGTRTAFETLVMEGQPVTPSAIVLPNSQAVVDFVAQNPNAIAYVSLAFIGQGVYTVPIEGIPPTTENLDSGSYLLTRDLFILAPKQGQPELEQFIEFVLSPAGQAIISTHWKQAK